MCEEWVPIVPRSLTNQSVYIMGIDITIDLLCNYHSLYFVVVLLFQEFVI